MERRYIDELIRARLGCPYVEGEEGYIGWWREELNRCLYGYEVGGKLITGEYYFFLNYFKINKLEGGKVVLGYPNYSEEDRELFYLVELAFNSGKNLLVITGRGYGKSYIGACILSHSYTFYRNSYALLGASTYPHGIKLWKKMVEGLDSLPKEMRHSKIKDKEGYIMSGVEYIGEKGERLRKGFNSEVEMIIFDDSGKARGGRPRRVILDEVGSWKSNLKDSYKAVENSLYRGSIRTGVAILFGTGGEMKSGGSIEARDMFFNPDAFNLYSFEVDNGKRVCYFIPAYKKLEGYYGEDGVSDEVGARVYLEGKRNKLLESGDIGAYESFIQEMPFEVNEAFLVSNITPFSFVRKRLEELLLISDREYGEIVKRGVLYCNGYRSGVEVEVEFKEDRLGNFVIIDEPIRVGGVVEEGRYIAGCDSYDQDKSLWSKSKGAVYVFDRLEGKFVAEYVDRPSNVEDFYEGVLSLCLYYNAKVMVEHSKIGIISYLKQVGWGSILASSPRLLNIGLKYSRVTNKYGYVMDYRRKMFAVERFSKYLKEGMEKLWIREQVEDIVNFNFEGNEYDRTIASMLCLVYDEELRLGFEERSSSFKFPIWRREGDKFVFG